MSTPCRATGRVREPAALAVDAARAAQVRADRRQERLVACTSVLDDLCPPDRRPRTRAEVAELYQVSDTAVHRVLRDYPQDFRADGWSESEDTWTDRAVVRAGMLLTQSETAAYLRYRLGLAEMPVMFAASDQRVRECQSQYEDALRLVEDIRQSCPADLWRELLHKDRYDLMGLVVTLAALVPEDQPRLGGWVKDMSAFEVSRRSIARGLTMLIPVRSRLHSRRAAPPVTVAAAAHAQQVQR